MTITPSGEGLSIKLDLKPHRPDRRRRALGAVSLPHPPSKSGFKPLGLPDRALSCSG